MKRYNATSVEGIHNIKIKLQRFDFIGHIYDTICGPCHGKEVLDFDFENWTGIEKSDCNCKEENGCYSATLTNAEGKTMEVVGDAKDFNNMIVKIEIIDYQCESTEY